MWIDALIGVALILAVVLVWGFVKLVRGKF